MGRRADAMQPSTTTGAHFLGAHDFQEIPLGQLTGRRQPPAELTNELGAQLQKVKSPFFRSIW